MKNKKEALILSAVLMAIAWFIVATWPSKPSGDSLTGLPAANFTLTDLAGQQVEFDKLREGKRVLLFFWATWCPYCHEKMTHLSSISKRLADKNVELVLINVGESPDKAKQYLTNMKVSNGTLLDSKSDVSYVYQAVGLPWFVLVNEQGMIEAADFDVPDL